MENKNTVDYHPSPWQLVSKIHPLILGHVHKYQLDFSPIVEIWYEIYKIICNINKIHL